MKKSIPLTLLLCLAFVFISCTSHAQESVFKAGVMFYNPTGISAKYWLSANTAVDLAVSLPSQTNEFSSSETNNFIVHSTYLKHERKIFRMDNGELLSYYGVGGTVTFQSNPIIGLRGVLGLEYFLPKIPFELFIEFSPVFNVYPASIVESAVGFGARYQF